GEVHVALRLHQQELDARPAADAAQGHPRLLAEGVAAPLAPETATQAACELINDEEPGVVPGSLVPGPRVAEPGHYFHGHYSPADSSSPSLPTTSGSTASAASSETTRGGTTATIASSRSSSTCASLGRCATRSETCSED